MKLLHELRYVVACHTLDLVVKVVLGTAIITDTYGKCS